MSIPMPKQLDAVSVASEPSSMETLVAKIEHLRQEMAENQMKREIEVEESLTSCGWVRSTTRFPILHLATSDDHRWAKVSFVDVGCWKSPSGAVFLTRLDQYNLEVLESEVKTKSLSEPDDIEGLLLGEDE